MWRKSGTLDDDRLLRRPIWPTHHPAKTHTHGKITTRPDIGAAQSEHHVHMRRPATKSSDSRDGRFHFLVRLPGQCVEDKRS